MDREVPQELLRLFGVPATIKFVPLCREVAQEFLNAVLELFVMFAFVKAGYIMGGLMPCLDFISMEYCTVQSRYCLVNSTREHDSKNFCACRGNTQSFALRLLVQNRIPIFGWRRLFLARMSKHGNE